MPCCTTTHFAVVGDDEAVQIEIEPVLHRRAVHLRHQTAGARQSGAVEPHPRGDGQQFVRRLAGMAAAPAAHMQPQFARQRPQPRFSARMTEVVMPEECQSIPITAPKDWNQKGCDRRAGIRRGHNDGRWPASPPPPAAPCAGQARPAHAHYAMADPRCRTSDPRTPHRNEDRTRCSTRRCRRHLKRRGDAGRIRRQIRARWRRRGAY